MKTARGFLFSGLHSGIKPNKKDLALVFSKTPCAGAACQTINRAKAAPVIDAESRVPSAAIHAVLINSGNANALTGAQGIKDVQLVTAEAAKALGVEGGVLMASTGVIGVRLPKEKILAAIPRLVESLKPAPESAAEAILTTDTRMKLSSRTLKLGRREVTLTAICKGSGMVAPQLATMICVIATDCAISPELLQQALRSAMNGTFNNLTIDNDMSTNDAVFALANGLAGNKPIVAVGAEYDAFLAQVVSICRELAKEIAADGEGATKLLEIEVSGAPTEEIAADIARSVAGSTLVKSSMFGADPNWGRVLATVGARAGSQKYEIEPQQSKVSIAGLEVFDREPVLEDLERLRARMRGPEVKVCIDLRSGKASSTAWGCDLSYDYVKINADYTSLLKTAPDGSVMRDDRLSNYSPKFKVTLLTQALSYITRFSDKRCVVKIGRAGLSKDSLRQAFCEDINLLRSVGMVPIVVHGESPRDLEIEDPKLRETQLSGATNTELVALLNRNGSSAIGLTGQDGALVRAQRTSRVEDGLELGQITQLDPQMLEMFVSRNYVPVIAPVGLGESGESIALDANDLAARIAGVLKAEKLVYLAGAPGLTEADALIQQVTSSRVEAMLAGNALPKGLRGKAQGALTALSLGVSRVHVIDARTPHSLIAELFTDDGVGTLVQNG